eukprot:SAG25_NODE_863_length_5020_cov_15.176793_4_plen_81_part_00
MCGGCSLPGHTTSSFYSALRRLQQQQAAAAAAGSGKEAEAEEESATELMAVLAEVGDFQRWAASMRLELAKQQETAEYGG